jgi:Tfp pilus assembly protein PilF
MSKKKAISLRPAILSLLLSFLPCMSVARADAPNTIPLMIQAMNDQYNGAEYVRAGRTAQGILNQDSDNLKAHFMMGQVYLKADLFENAELEYNWCIVHGKNSAEANMARTAIASMHEAQQQAAPTANIALPSAPLNLPPPPPNSYAPYTTPAASPKSALLMQTMTTQYKAGQYVQAGHTGQAILAVDPQNLEAHYLMANVFLKAEALDNAGAEYEWCIAHGPGTQIGDYAQMALDVMEGRKTPGAALRAISMEKAALSAQEAAKAAQTAQPALSSRLLGLPITRQATSASAAAQPAQKAATQLPTQFYSPYSADPNAQNANYKQAPVQAQTIAAYPRRNTYSGSYATDYRMNDYTQSYNSLWHTYGPVPSIIK